MCEHVVFSSPISTFSLIQYRTGNVTAFCCLRQGKRVDTSIDVGISYVMSSVSSSRKRRQAASEDEQTKTTVEKAKTTEEPPQTAAPELGGRAEKAFAISLLDSPEITTTTGGQSGELSHFFVPGRFSTIQFLCVPLLFLACTGTPLPPPSPLATTFPNRHDDGLTNQSGA